MAEKAKIFIAAMTTCFSMLVFTITARAQAPELKDTKDTSRPETESSNGAGSEISSRLKVQIYGYPARTSRIKSFSQFNPLQPENLSLTTPGLTIAKLGTLGQKTSLRFNSYSSGELTFLFDGFEISDPSDPNEGFELGSFLMVPQFDMQFSNSQSLGLFSRQAGGVISIDPQLNSKSYVHSAGGSLGQGLLAVQKNMCSLKECLSLGVGGTMADGTSASSNSQMSTSILESDEARLGFLSLGWHRQLGADRLVKLRAHSQYSKVDIDDYDENFIFRDDPNANLQTWNHFLGVSYLTNSNQYFFENIYSDREVLNQSDLTNPVSRDEQYRVLRTKLRGSHKIYSTPKDVFTDLDFYWFGQNVDLQTQQQGSLIPTTQSKELSRLEAGIQLDQKLRLDAVTGKSSASVNALEGFDFSYSLTQSFESGIWSSANQSAILQANFGANQRRPSLFQLFDPQFGNGQLENEKQIFFRPKLKWSFTKNNIEKHNISVDYFLENINQRVVFTEIPSTGNFGYRNSGQLTSNSLILDYAHESPASTSRIFYRRSLDSVATLQSLPWMARQEFGLGQSLHSRVWGRQFDMSVDIKWLQGMYNPSREQIGNLVQSQGTLSYQIDTNDRISLQLNNLFNDKRIWDEGFQRQPFSWMLSVTKTI